MDVYHLDKKFSSELNNDINIHLSSASDTDPVFFITSRNPAHVVVCTSPREAYDWLLNRLTLYKDDPKEALNFEITDLYR